jgi:hypothetical protein
MPKRKHIDDILRTWKHDPHSPNVRIVKGIDGRDVLQMRVDMGVLQLETDGRPDGERPHGARTWCDYLARMAREAGEEFVMDEEQCGEVDREFVQFYHRRICWLALHNFRRAVQDADHTLRLMDLCREHSPDEQWTLSHEQYRPFVLFHRTQAAALAELEKADVEVLSASNAEAAFPNGDYPGPNGDASPSGRDTGARNGDPSPRRGDVDRELDGGRPAGSAHVGQRRSRRPAGRGPTSPSATEEVRSRCAEAAVQEINEGLERIKGLFQEFEAEEHFDDDELVNQLIDLREKLRDRFQVGRTLNEQLSDAIQAEEYERAAVLRDKLAQRARLSSGSH